MQIFFDFAAFWGRKSPKRLFHKYVRVRARDLRTSLKIGKSVFRAATSATSATKRANLLKLLSFFCCRCLGNVQQQPTTKSAEKIIYLAVNTAFFQKFSDRRPSATDRQHVADCCRSVADFEFCRKMRKNSEISMSYRIFLVFLLPSAAGASATEKTK